MKSVKSISDWIGKLWVVIPVHNRWPFTRACLMSLERQTAGVPNVLVVDDGSTDGTAAVIQRDFPAVEVVRGSGNDWWTGATNRGVRRALTHGAEWIFLLNNDTELAPDCLARLQDVARNQPATLIGCASYNIETGRLIYGGTRLNWWPGPFEVPVKQADAAALTDVTHLPGRGMLVPTEVFGCLGLFDAYRFPQRVADYDFSHRAFLAGYSLKVCRRARVYMHVSGASSGAQYCEKPSVRRLIDHLTAVNGPANLRYFASWTWGHCPRSMLIPYFAWGVAARLGGYVRDWLAHWPTKRIRA